MSLKDRLRSGLNFRKICQSPQLNVPFDVSNRAIVCTTEKSRKYRLKRLVNYIDIITKFLVHNQDSTLAFTDLL